jgi:hypothetical protein
MKMVSVASPNTNARKNPIKLNAVIPKQAPAQALAASGDMSSYK